MHAIGQLAGGIAHEFNNMLTVISGYAQLLKAQLPPQSPGLDAVSHILKAAARNAEVTRQLLAFSGQQILRPQVLPVNRLVHAAEGLLARLLGEQYRVKVHAGQDAGWVRVDPTQTQQVLLNLALNARDAMPGGGTLTIETRNRMVPSAEEQDPGLPHGSYVEIVVSDTGRGMSENELAHIFEPFYTTKESARSVGLGLPVIYGIIEQSGGQIRVQSVEGKGTTFTIFFPRTSPEDTPAEIPLRFPGRAVRDTILLVEDEDDVRILAGHLLRQSGYEVLDARTPSEALDRFDRRAQDVRLLLTDVVLPEMSGHELALRLRQKRADLRVVFMSGYGASEMPESESLRAPFLSKPFDLTTLQTVVRQALD
jgi:CheY-like chemotaxis protein